MRSSIFTSTLFVSTFVCLIVRTHADGELFKINKLNLIWSKAQHSLGATKLKDLKNELTKHEIEELALKKMKAHNQDKDGLFEAAVRKKLLSILAQYSLDRYYDDIHPPHTREHSAKKDNLDKVKSSPDYIADQKSTFRDKKLDKLWRKAEQSGFTQEQLMILHEEFEHQQDKLDEHYNTMNHLEQEIDKKSRGSDLSENSLEEGPEKIEETPNEKKSRLEANVHQSLKDKYGNIKKDYEKLHKKIIDRAIEPVDGPFQEDQVNKLWLAAQDANFDEKELESLKEELSDYELRLKKLKHFENQLERDSLGAKDPAPDQDDHELKHIRKRVAELTKKVEKSQKILKKKIVDRRDEL